MAFRLAWIIYAYFMWTEILKRAMSLSFYSNLESFLVFFFFKTQLISLQVDQQKMDQADVTFMWWMHLEEDSVLNWDSNKLEIREKLSGSAVRCIFHSILKTAHMWRSVAVSFPDQNYSQCSICALLTSGHTVLSIFEPIACYLSHESFQI